MLHAASRQFVVSIREQCYLFHGPDAVDVWHDPLHCEVPVLVHQRLWPDGEDGDMPGLDGWRRVVGGEEFDVEGIQLVDGYHALAIIVQVFHEHLAQRVEFASAWGRGVAGEEVGLLFEAAHEVGELGDDRFVGIDVR